MDSTVKTVGQHSDIAVDATGAVHLSYYDATSKDLRLAFLPDCDSSCTKASCSSAGASCGVMFDACGGTLSCGSCNFPKLCGGGTAPASCGCTTGAWRIETVDTPGSTGSYTSVAVDSKGGVHIAYYDESRKDLRHAYRAQGGDWVAETVESPGTVGEYAAIALDSKDGVHIAYRDGSSSHLKYAHRAAAAASWTIEKVETLSGTGSYTGIALDGSDGVHIAYQRIYQKASYVTAFEIKYAYRAAGASAWSKVKVDDGATGWRIAIRVDGSSGVHMAYGSENTYYGSGTLRYAYKASGGSWTTTQVSSAAKWVGVYPSLVVDAVGQVHIAHYNATNKNLLYTTKGSGSTGWTTATVDATGSVGRYPGLGADSLGGLHVVYYDESNSALRYASKPPGGSWTATTVESAGTVGDMGWLAVDGSNHVHASYRGDGDLKYALLPKCP